MYTYRPTLITQKSLSPEIHTDLSKLSTLLCKRAEYLYCCDSLFKMEEERNVSPVRVSFDEGSGGDKNPLSVVNVSKNILE